MTIEEKIKLNKDIRSYKGNNQFIISLQKTLKGSYIQKVEYNGKNIKILSDKQYEAAKINF
jgi:hypothetical protein